MQNLDHLPRKFRNYTHKHDIILFLLRVLAETDRDRTSRIPIADLLTPKVEQDRDPPIPNKGGNHDPIEIQRMPLRLEPSCCQSYTPVRRRTHRQPHFGCKPELVKRVRGVIRHRPRRDREDHRRTWVVALGPGSLDVRLGIKSSMIKLYLAVCRSLKRLTERVNLD